VIIYRVIPVKHIIDAYQCRESSHEGIYEIQELLWPSKSNFAVAEPLAVDGVHANRQEEQHLDVEEQRDPVVVSHIRRPLYDWVVESRNVIVSKALEEVEGCGRRDPKFFWVEGDCVHNWQ
jgi:hypothetical protein